MQNEIQEYENNTIRIKVQQVRNKKVTKIGNVPEEKLIDLTKLLKKKLACGGSIDVDKSIILQGDKTHTELIQILKVNCVDHKIEMNGKMV